VWGGRWIGSPQKIVWRHDDRAYYPTLEELIEACGEKFENLWKVDKEWQASGWIDEDHLRGFDASSPAEAVGRLWLALNEHEPS